jgi:septal ring factor EnvC (AmiA/AmiB activator)
MGEENKINGLTSSFLYLPLLSFIFMVSPVLAESDNPDLQKGKKDLQGIRKEIREKKKGLAEAGKKEKGLLAEIERIGRRLHALEAEERRLDRETITLEKGLKEKTAAVSILGREMERKKGLLSKRLAFLYKARETGYLRFLLTSEGSADAGQRFRYMVRVADHDRELIRGYGRDMSNLSRQMAGIRADKERLEGAEKELAKKRVEIKREREERDRLLAAVRKEKIRYKESIKELQANARNLERLLDRLERQASIPTKDAGRDRIKGYAESGFGRQKGLLDFPVRGEVVGSFGKEIEEGSKTVVYRKGIEIRAKGDSEIRAVYGGRVIFADQFKGYGLMVIIDHGGGYYTLYARASKILKKLNDEINKGDIIGIIGESDSLYFEVRSGGKPENPLYWLKS